MMLLTHIARLPNLRRGSSPAAMPARCTSSDSTRRRRPSASGGAPARAARARRRSRGSAACRRSASTRQRNGGGHICRVRNARDPRAALGGATAAGGRNGGAVLPRFGLYAGAAARLQAPKATLAPQALARRGARGGEQSDAAVASLPAGSEAEEVARRGAKGDARRRAHKATRAARPGVSRQDGSRSLNGDSGEYAGQRRRLRAAGTEGAARRHAAGVRRCPQCAADGRASNS